MAKPGKRMPELRSEAEMREFWAKSGRDSTQYLDWGKARVARFPNVKLSTRSISLRLPESLLESIRLEANKRDVPYQSLIKVWLAEKVASANGPLPLKGIIAKPARPVTIAAMKRAIARGASGK